MAMGRGDAIFGHAADDALGNGGQLRLRATGADDERLGNGSKTAYIKDQDVGGLLLFRKEGDLSRKVVWLNR